MSTQVLKTREEQLNYVGAALERAEELRRKKQHKEAVSLLVDALRYGIDKATIYYRLGNTYFDQDDLSRAEYAYTRALEIDSKHVNAMHNLAVVYKRQKKMSLYVKTYKKSQRLSLRRPRDARLSASQKRHLRWLSGKVLLWIVAGAGGIVLIVWLVTR
ncbi:tetratricopeptide repeat protein [Candidatus Bipolaricaulota bacterium]|nr:tetratricopeptide repeat protein [Candidatus Bipolaricaulota bacterium]